MKELSEEYLLSFAEGYKEGVPLDYKEQGYIISVPKQDKRDEEKVKKAERKKQDLIIDLTSMANANGMKTAIIITGIKENEGSFETIGILKGCCSDHIYQELLKLAVSPPIQFTYCEVTDSKGMTFGFFILQNNINRPYMLTKDLYGDFRKGTIPFRLGSTNQILTNYTQVEKWKQADVIQRQTNEEIKGVGLTSGVVDLERIKRDLRWDAQFKSSYTDKRALLIKLKSLQALDKFLLSNVGNVEYVGYCKDGTEMVLTSLEDILGYESPPNKRIAGLKIEATSEKSPDAYVEIVLKEGTWTKTNAEVKFHCNERTWGIKTESQLTKKIKDLRVWYWWLRKIRLVYIFPLILICSPLWIRLYEKTQELMGTSLSSSEITASMNLSKDETSTLLLVISIILFVLGIILDRVKNWIFPNIYFCIGKQAVNRHRILSLGGILFIIFLGMLIHQIFQIILIINL